MPKPKASSIKPVVLSDSEIAERMRPLRLTVGADGVAWELTGPAPSVESIAEARAKQAAGIRMRIGPKGQEIESTSPEFWVKPAQKSVGVFNNLRMGSGYAATRRLDLERQTASAGVSGLSPFDRDPTQLFLNLDRYVAADTGELPDVPLGVSPNDDRWWATPTQRNTWPLISSISLSSIPYGVADRCSAISVGQYTALSAAHCFYNVPQNGGPAPSGAWKSTRAFAVGRVNRYHNSLGVPERTAIVEPWNGCYTITLPTAYISTNGDYGEDWAVIDFHGAGACGLSPGAAPGSGWVWPSVGQPTDFYENILQQHGYDVVAPEPPQNDPTYTYLVPSLISRAYGIHRITVTADSRVLVGQVDITRAGSGAGLLQRLYWYSSGNPEYYISGIAVAADPDWPYETLYRRLDQNIWNFTKAYCTEY